MRRFTTAVVCGVLLLSASGASQGAGGQGGRGGGAGGGRLPSIADRTTGFQKLDGFVPLYWEESTGSLLIEIPKLDTELLYVTGVGAGLGSNDIGIDRAQLGGTRIVSFQRVGPKIFMVQPNYDYRAVSTNPYERRAVEDAFAKSIIWGFTAAAESDGRVLVDAADFLMRDSANVGARLGAYRFDRTRSAVYMPSTKAFPKNTEIEVTSTFVSDGAGGRGGGAGGGGRGGGPQIGGTINDVVPSAEAATIRLHHSFIELPDANYKPRKFDPRAGFFGIDYVDFSAAFGADMRVHYMSRHRLEKKDPAAAVSEAVKPIVYYVDRGAPEPIRSALVEGASWWSAAFEAAGFRNAFRVELLPEGADPMDVRYNTITWVHRSTRGWSYGSSITDPRTGEIIKGHVSLGSLRAQQDYLIGEGLLAPYENGTEKPQALTEMVLGRLRQLAAHETGHTLGLSHEYYDSALGWISVMDYPHPMVSLGRDGSMDFSKAYANNIGEWDKVAIRYGYGVYPAATEAATLKEILDSAWTKDLRFMTNQDSDVNPRVDQWNNSNEVAGELLRILSLRRAGLAKFGDRNIQNGWPMAMLEEVLVPLFLHHRYATEAAASAIGGQNYIYALRGDGRTPTEWVPAATQRASLDALLLTLKPSELALPKQVLTRIPPRPSGIGRTRELFPRMTGGAFDPITPGIIAADMTLDFLLTDARAARMVTQKAIDPVLPGLEDVIDKVVTATFDAATASPYEAELSRGVQRVVVSHLMQLANSAPMAQVRAIAAMKLKAIQTRMGRATTAPITTGETAHRQLLAMDINRFFNGPGDPASRIIAVPGLPPGAPIDSGMDYLLGLSLECLRNPIR